MKNTKKLVLSGMFIAIGIVLPFITGEIPEIGKMLCPMHIPVMLCGIFCGWQYGIVVGFVTPILRSILVGMPVMIPGGVSMAFELATYALVIAILYRLLPKKIYSIYIALIVSMVCGRVVWGIARLIIAGVINKPFTTGMFISGAITTAIPGIIVQLVLIPVLVILINRNAKEIR